MFIKKLLLVLFMLLFVLSCGNTATTPSEDADLSFLDRVTDKFLVDEDGRYISPYYTMNGINYHDSSKLGTDSMGITTFVEAPSKTKGIYRLRGDRESYYGHEIKSGVLYITGGIIATDTDSIKWEDAKEVGNIINDYSGEFLSSVKGKKLSGCANYFNYETGKLYIEKLTSIDENFTFVQASSTTKAIYENKKDGVLKFIGLSIVNGNLYSTDHFPNINTVNENWGNTTDRGKLLDN